MSATELESLTKLKTVGKLHFWRGTIEMPERELHTICDEIQAECDRAVEAALGRAVDKGEPQGADGHLDQSQVDWLRLMPDGWDGTPPETAREGLWYSSLYDEADPDGAYAWRCSACRAFARDYGIEGLPIVRCCPSCGARMTGVRQ